MDKINQYCKEMTDSGYTCREDMVRELLTIPSRMWGFKYSDTEIAVASRIQSES